MTLTTPDILYPLAVTYGALPVQPLRISAVVDGPIAHYDPVNLDNVIAAAVVRHAAGGNGLAESANGYYIPLPLACLYTDPATGHPLWAATVLEPEGEAHRSVTFANRPAIKMALMPDRNGRPYNLNPKLGRYKETQVRLPLTVATVWSGDVIGNREAIEDLLPLISHLGKGRSQGLGAVVEWWVEPIAEFHLADVRGHTRRTLPLSYLDALGVEYPHSDAAYMAWTVPYWVGVPSCRDRSLPTGSRIPDLRCISNLIHGREVSMR